MKRMRLSTKLVLFFLFVGIVPFAAIGITSLVKTNNALSQIAFNQLHAMREVKKKQIETFFTDRQRDMNVLAETVRVLRREALNKLLAVQQIKKNQIENYIKERLGEVSVLAGNNEVISSLRAFQYGFENDGNKTGGENWNETEALYSGWLKKFKTDYGYVDLLLIDTKGRILYSVSKRSDLGQNLLKEPLRDSPLGKCFDKSMEHITIQDFEPYAPAHNEPCAFIGAPVRMDEETIGVIALQLPTHAINEIMQERKGMGKTGEVYLVGPDKLMRSDSVFDPEHHSVKTSFANPETGRVDTEASRNALSGKSAQDVILGYKGSPALVAYSQIKSDGINWAVIAEIEVAEAFSPIDETGNEFYAKYTKTYGYHDLLLINPDGYVFYTVAKNSEYRTNLSNGIYSSTNLAKLVQQTLVTKQFGISDFAPYAPSDNEPYAFIDQPVVHEGSVEMVIALKLSLDTINSIMQQRDGMGETGETYLVGSDKLMRSDSFGDPTYHSVKASFENPQMGSVDTEAVREALSGKTGMKIMTGYKGDSVLSAYTPINIENTQWALITEIKETEAFGTISSLTWIMGIISLIGISAIVAIALLISRSITNPISRVISGLNKGAGQVTSASSQVSAASQSLAEGASEQAASLEETSSSLEEMSSMTKQNADNAGQADNLMKEANRIVEKANHSMTELTSSMDDISKASEETSKIIKTIDEIAFQTNLLALNAAVEAARAGEAGAGFAVVADEVRNLALRAADAAKNTSALIEETVKKINNGSKIVNTTNQAFNEVAVSSKKVGELVGEISAASKEQAEGIEQVNRAVVDMDKITQQNAANAEESASASEEMNAQANQMLTYVQELVQMVGGAVQNKKSISRSSSAHDDPNQHLLSRIPTRKKIANKALTAKTGHDIPLEEDDDFTDF